MNETPEYKLITNKAQSRLILDLLYEKQRAIIKRLKVIRNLESYKRRADNNFNLDFTGLKFEIKALKYEHDLIKSIASLIPLKTIDGIYSDDNMVCVILTDFEQELIKEAV